MIGASKQIYQKLINNSKTVDYFGSLYMKCFHGTDSLFPVILILTIYLIPRHILSSDVCLMFDDDDVDIPKTPSKRKEKKSFLKTRGPRALRFADRVRFQDPGIPGSSSIPASWDPRPVPRIMGSGSRDPPSTTFENNLFF
jgi:hypothetical protein